MSAGKRNNSRKTNRISKINESFSTVEKSIGRFANHISFNFSFFDKNQNAGQDFRDWGHKDLYELLEKFKDFSGKTRVELQQQKHGKTSTLSVYGEFPTHSDFIHPEHVPDDACWARFRLEGDKRLIGFFISAKNCPPELSPDVFYIVFLDENHRFYKTEK